MTRNIQEDRWIRYLLRDMSEQEREKIEEMYVTNAERHEELCAIEDELIVQYLDNRLPARDKRLFEAAYNATKAQRSKLADISQIHNSAKSSAGKPTEPERRAVRLTLGDILSFSLTPSYAVRGGKEAEHTPPPLVEVPRIAAEFELHPVLVQPEDYPAYRAELETGGAEVWHAADLQAEAAEGRRSLNLRVPCTGLADGDYLLLVFGLRAAGKERELKSYDFHLQFTM